MKNIGITSGVNLGGWLSQCDYSRERLDTFIGEEDFATIASWGVDHVRLPVDYPVLANEHGWERLDFAVTQCEKHGLGIVIDLHKAAGYEWVEDHQVTDLFSSEHYQEKYCCLWEELARRYGERSQQVYFELLNELTDPALTPAWNRLVQRVIRRIRTYAPSSWIIVGSHSYNSPAAVPDLDAPCDDHVIYNFHCYEPFAYTHQGAHWVMEMDKSLRIPFAESGTTEALFDTLFAPAIAHAQANGTPLYCGEYGVIDVVDPADAIKWIRTITDALRKHGIPHAIWNYKQLDFGLTDSRWDDLRSELVKVL